MRINVASIIALATMSGACLIPVPAQASPFGWNDRQKLVQNCQTNRQPNQEFQVVRLAGRRDDQRLNSKDHRFIIDRQADRRSNDLRQQEFMDRDRVNFDSPQIDHQFQR